MPICLNCNVKFPNFLIIDNKERNLQRRKYCINCSPFGGHNTSKIAPITNLTDGSIKRKCGHCKNIYPKTLDFFHKRSDTQLSFICKKCSSFDRSQKRRDLKVKAVEYKGGKCLICNYNKCIRSLKFHHLDPSKKEFSMSHNGSHHNWNKLKKELDKCILICGNCHDEIHHGMHPQYLVVKEQ